MNVTLVTGGCGFVGRHLIARLLRDGHTVWIVDDLSTGQHPDQWLEGYRDRQVVSGDTISYLMRGQTVLFTQSDLLPLLYKLDSPDQLQQTMSISSIGDAFHLASVVGGRVKIEGDPIEVAIDLAIDAAFFRWVVRHRDVVGRVLYASSSAAYPVHLQSQDNAIALKEVDISFDQDLGQPDMTYGWSKLTGEYLAQLAAAHYGVHVACVRPFSGYGGDQDTSYPVPAIAQRAAGREDPLVIWGTGEQGRDFVHIDDCIEGMLRALDRISDGSGINIGSGQLVTFKEVAAILAEIAGYSPQITPLVDKPMGVAARYADITEMTAQLDWTPAISLREGLRRVLDEQSRLLDLAYGR